MACKEICKRSRRQRRDAPSEQFGARALQRLAWLMENAESEQAQVSAAKELLDRVRGPSSAQSSSAGDNGLRQVVARLRELRPRRGAKASSEG